MNLLHQAIVLCLQCFLLNLAFHILVLQVVIFITFLSQVFFKLMHFLMKLPYVHLSLNFFHLFVLSLPCDVHRVAHFSLSAVVRAVVAFWLSCSLSICCWACWSFSAFCIASMRCCMSSLSVLFSQLLFKLLHFVLIFTKLFLQLLLRQAILPHLLLQLLQIIVAL